ncbi:MAG TPA: hypothetical protein VIH17_01805 [Candidatus Acidoferrales bacterium]
MGERSQNNPRSNIAENHVEIKTTEAAPRLARQGLFPVYRQTVLGGLARQGLFPVYRQTVLGGLASRSPLMTE